MTTMTHPRYKIIVVGDTNVGKTSIINKFTKDTFDQSMISTIGIDFVTKQIIAKSKPVSLQIWDTAGQERFRSLTQSYYRSAHAVILVFNLEKEESLESLDRWIADIREFASVNVPIVLVGNKLDVIKIERDRIKKIADLLNLQFFLTSAKNADNIGRVFEFIGDILIDQRCEEVKTKKNKVFSKLKSIRKKTCC